MQKRVPVSELQVGMYIVSTDASWLQNPFWRSKMLINHPLEIKQLVEAGIEWVVIDTAKGLVPAVAQADPLLEESAGPASSPSELVVERRASPRPRPRITEVERAQAIVERSKSAVTAMFGEARLGHAVRVEDVAPLVDEISASMARDRSAILNVTRLKTKDEYTYLHSVAVCALMMNFARELRFPQAEVHEIGIAGLLHDIGKMAIPTEVLEKPGALDEEEQRIIRGHPEKGAQLLRGSEGVTAATLDVCLHHHERIDGRGYPFGLSARDLSQRARMSAICDVYDAVTSTRPYKDAWSPSEALTRMLSWEGHFDPALLDIFVRSIGIYPLGGLVRLHSGRLAVVMAADAASPTAPQVRAFYDITGAHFIEPVDLSTANRAGGDPIVSGERGTHWFRDAWPQVLACVQSGRRIPRHGLAFTRPVLPGEERTDSRLVAGQAR